MTLRDISLHTYVLGDCFWRYSIDSSAQTADVFVRQKLRKKKMYRTGSHFPIDCTETQSWNSRAMLTLWARHCIGQQPLATPAVSTVDRTRQAPRWCDFIDKHRVVLRSRPPTFRHNLSNGF